MTKDRTVKSVLGKYVAPIAGAVVAPFALPALLGGGGAAAGGAGCGWRGPAREPEQLAWQGTIAGYGGAASAVGSAVKGWTLSSRLD